MIREEIVVECDGPNCSTEYSAGDDTHYQALCNAGSCGWTTRSINDQEFDLCPECSKLKSEEIDLE